MYGIQSKKRVHYSLIEMELWWCWDFP